MWCKSQTQGICTILRSCLQSSCLFSCILSQTGLHCLARAETAEGSGYTRLQLWVACLTTIVYSRCQVLCITQKQSQKTYFNTYRISLRQTPSAFTILKSSCLEGKSLLPSYATNVKTGRNGTERFKNDNSWFLCMPQVVPQMVTTSRKRYGKCKLQ